MKRHLFQSISVLCLIAAFSLVSCGDTEDQGGEPGTQQPEEVQILFSAILAPRSGFPQAEAFTSGTEAGEEVLNLAWVKHEVAIYYQKTDDSYGTACAVIDGPNGDGSASISALLPDAKGDTAKFVYPFMLADDEGGIYAMDLYEQNGHLTSTNGLGTPLDAATGEAIITVNGLKASVSDNITMTNSVCICKFHFDIVENYGEFGPTRNFSPITIDDGYGHIYTIVSDRTDEMVGGPRGFNRTDDIYVAMLPVKDKTLKFSTTYGTTEYSFTALHTTLTEGVFYNDLSIQLVKGGHEYYDYTLTGSASSTVIIPDGGTLRLNDALITTDGVPASVCEGDATITLEGSNSVETSVDDKAVIQAGPAGSTLTINGTGTLAVDNTAKSKCTGIGSYSKGTCGNIVINGGTVTVTLNCANSGAGIGSGPLGTCGDITINGGTVSAKCGEFAAAIGTGYCGHCGNVTIGSGVTCITANKSAKNPGPYNIGLGKNSLNATSTCGTVIIGDTTYYDGSAFLNGGETYLATNPFIYQP